MFSCLFMFWETDRDRARAGEGQREEETQNSNRLQALSCQHRARCGARTREPRDHDLSQSRTLNWLSHPDAPRTRFLIYISAKWMNGYHLSHSMTVACLMLHYPTWIVTILKTGTGFSCYHPYCHFLSVPLLNEWTYLINTRDGRK